MSRKPGARNAGYIVIVLNFLLIVIASAHLVPVHLFAQRGQVVRETVYSKAIGDTATGENPDRNVSVYLPPGYHKDAHKRYPVIFLLHGIGDTEQVWTSGWSEADQPFETIQAVMNRGIAAGKFNEMIVVMPDERTNCHGSFYVNSKATGNWEDFTVRELVEHVDSNYRTLAKPESRGIMGHSMGGYGALTLSMKHPDVFCAAFGMNSAIIDWTEELTLSNSIPRYQRIHEAKSFDDFQMPEELLTLATITLGQAFSPNPDKAPFFVDLPYKQIDGKWQPNEPAYSQWQANLPVKMVEKYQSSLKQLKGIGFDSGFDDEFEFIPVNSRLLSKALEKHGIGFYFEEYDGDHRNRLWGENGRLYSVIIPWFSNLLEHQ